MMSEARRDCMTCSKLRTGECKRPDECVMHGYKDWSRLPPWKMCRECGSRMRVDATKRMSENTRVVYIVCPGCGQRAKVTKEYQAENVESGPV